MDLSKDTPEEAHFKLADGDDTTDVRILNMDSTSAIGDLVGGSVDLAASTRSVRGAELENLIGASADDFAYAEAETVLALDALVVVVSPNNPLRAIAEEDVARVFAGEITDWAEIGGEPGPINLYVRNAGSGTATVFEDLVSEPGNVTVSNAAQPLTSDVAIVDAVLNDPNGIGYTSFSTLGSAKPLAIRGECGLQTPVNDFTIKTEEYPLTRRLFLYRPSESIPRTAADFLQFVKSNEAQKIVKDAGFVGQDTSWLSVNEQGLRFVSSVLPNEADVTIEGIQDMMTELVAADRLSLTFRFQSGSARLDTRAQADALRLAELIDQGFFEGKELILVGFTDSIGLGQLNEDLSRARAEQVVDVVRSIAQSDANVPIRTIGYGEMTPLGCNETSNGRRVNRRVEVWMKDIIGSRI
jgi:phosphate transport system substrate-binding protein